MSLRTLEVEIDHGRVVVKGSEPLPDNASALLTILPRPDATDSPPEINSELHEDAERTSKPENCEPAPAPGVVRNGIRLFPLRGSSVVVTPEIIAELLEEPA